MGRCGGALCQHRWPARKADTRPPFCIGTGYALPASCGLYVPEAHGSLAALAADYCAYAVNVPRALPPQATSQACTARRSKPQ